MNFAVFAFKSGMKRSKHHVIDELRRQGHNVFWADENTALEADFGFDNFISLVFDPSIWHYHDQPHGNRLVYWCVDYWRAFEIFNASFRGIERKLINTADICIAASDMLFEMLAVQRKDKVTRVIKHGVDYNLFSTVINRQLCDTATEIKELPSPVIGYWGSVAHWLDFDLLNSIRKHPLCGSLVLIGKVRDNVSSEVHSLLRWGNVHILGEVEHKSLPSMACAFDVAIAPFRVTDQTYYSNSLKIREYLAAGLPVVATDLPETRNLSFVRTADSHRDFIKQISLALKEDLCRREEISFSMKNETWERRVSEFLKLL